MSMDCTKVSPVAVVGDRGFRASGTVATPSLDALEVREPVRSTLSGLSNSRSAQLPRSLANSSVRAMSFAARAFDRAGGRVAK
jgi:hypothetical protein